MSDTKPAPRLPSRAEALAREPCPHCGLQVVYGQTAAGTRVAVDPQVQTYVLVWDRGTGTAGIPRLVQSRGYVAHACGGEFFHNTATCKEGG